MSSHDQAPGDPIDHAHWMDLAHEEYRRLDELLAGLSEAEWLKSTECVGWRVREIVAHLAGAAAATASVREQLRQQRLGAKEKGERLQIDAVNDIQIRERDGLTSTELRRQLADTAQRSIRARRRTPAWVRALRFRFPPPVGQASIGFLNDVIYTRDAWMHRVDLCRATGRPLELTSDHDTTIVAHAARAWLKATATAGITLTGPAGSTLGQGAHPTLRLDAIEFARALSGRTTIPGIAADLVLF